MINKFPMITKFPNAILSGKIPTLIFSFSYSFLAKTYESHTQFYTLREGQTTRVDIFTLSGFGCLLTVLVGSSHVEHLYTHKYKHEHEHTHTNTHTRISIYIMYEYSTHTHTHYT